MEIATPAIAACDDIRHEDRKIDCYGRMIAPGGVRLGKQIDKALKGP